MAITPEQLQKLKEITGDAPAPITPVTPPEQLTDPLTHTPVPQATPTPVPGQPGSPTYIDPVNAAKPYIDQGNNLNAQAAGMRAQAMQPPAQPQGGKEGLIVGLRNAMENMGRWGAPGGFYGQQEIRDQQEMQRRAAQLAQAKDLQDMAEKQQGLGINAENVARQENFNQGQLTEMARGRAVQEARDAETVRHNQAMEDMDHFAKGANGQVFSTKSGDIAHEGTTPAAKMQSKAGTLDGQNFFANYDAAGGKYYDPRTNEDISGRFQPFAPGSGQSPEQIVQSGDQYKVVNKKTATARDVTQNGPNGAKNPLPIEATAQERNRSGQAKIVDSYADHVLSLVDSVGDQLGPIAGRISRGEIKLGDAPANVRALYTALQSFDALQPIMHGFRGGSQTVDHFHSAVGGLETNPEGLRASINEIKGLAQAIRSGTATSIDATAAPAAGGGSNSSVPTVGGTFNGGKVLKVTPIP